MEKMELIPTNGRKSFGGKAVVKVFDNGDTKISVLQSYYTDVAEYRHGTNKMIIYPNKNGGDKTYGNTTRAHINSFLNFYGFDKCTKKEMEKYFNN